eukprot:3881632-Heterocapsa_arctica.AAC.1
MREHSHVWQDNRDVLRVIPARQPPRGEYRGNGGKGPGKGTKRQNSPPATPPRTPRVGLTATPLPLSPPPPLGTITTARTNAQGADFCKKFNDRR